MAISVLDFLCFSPNLHLSISLIPDTVRFNTSPLQPRSSFPHDSQSVPYGSWNKRTFFSNTLSSSKLSFKRENENSCSFSDRTIQVHDIGIHHQRIQCSLSDLRTEKPQIPSLASRSWFKLICGASNTDLASTRNLAYIYTLAGADCIDCSTDPSITTSIRQAMDAALQASSSFSFTSSSSSLPLLPRLSYPGPLLMVSMNDHESDPHFRKAFFPAHQCPTSCSQPCIPACPATAITALSEGVLTDKCYGCGRCIPVCPQKLIETVSYKTEPAMIFAGFPQGGKEGRQETGSCYENRSGIDAVEIHTKVEHMDDFQALLQTLRTCTIDAPLRLIAVSFPDPRDDERLVLALKTWSSTIRHQFTNIPIVWQTDGRPMSGDLGTKGVTRPAIQFGRKVARLIQQNHIPGYVQLAGGTNNETVPMLAEEQDHRHLIAGVAYGGYARKLVAGILEELEVRAGASARIEDHQDLLQRALDLVVPFVSQIKS